MFLVFCLLFINDTATNEIYTYVHTLSLHGALPIWTIAMGTDRWKVLLGFAALLAVGGCASGEEWSTWREHPTHFASGDHMFFSTRNAEGTQAREIGRAHV